MTTDIQNLKSFDPFAEADDTGGETKTSQQNYIHIRIQRTYTTLPHSPRTAQFMRIVFFRSLRSRYIAQG
jgi:hypothetical protein